LTKAKLNDTNEMNTINKGLDYTSLYLPSNV